MNILSCSKSSTTLSSGRDIIDRCFITFDQLNDVNSQLLSCKRKKERKMYQFIKSLLPTRTNQIKRQEMIEDISETVQEAKQDVTSGQDIEFELSLAINRTSTTLDKLEAQKDEQTKKLQLMEKTLSDLSKYELSDQQKQRRDTLEKQLNEVVKKQLKETELEIDELTRKLLVLYNKRDIIAQKKVNAQDGIEGAISLPLANSQDIRLDSLDGEQMVGADSIKTTEATTTTTTTTTSPTPTPTFITTDQTITNNEEDDLTNSIASDSNSIV
ncbi:hypothetical protein PPL_00904 [Heterostelium album PN500]|uniref:Uncharacterized protein n=1 Tax=Heterostelium pallidum (strain ATCC 26659 / Pp 5 / PN500) TaxID=670386 RepID=D3AYY5_HETP5|nr:hypothetical protein PPL_00904 [Heterostelium album PN500]EFA85675.1 hypothetical protein PPL_00904 [Heterostelium album PN500]|eukprot:XP_020437782.1 hypothetical protein PPL_00904 [Heterostelium album PN500]